MAKPADSLASFTNRLVALETRVNALETKDAELAAAVSNLTGRVAALEAGDYGARLDTLRMEVDDLMARVYSSAPELIPPSPDPLPEPTYGCRKPTTTSTLTNHIIYGGTHDVVYSGVRFEGNANVSGKETVAMWLGRSGTPDADIYNVVFEDCVFATCSYASSGPANAFHMWNTSTTGKTIHDVTFTRCWFEPQTRMQVELNGRGGWWHDFTFQDCTFEGSCAQQFSCDMAPTNATPTSPYGVTVGGVVRGVEGLLIDGCLFEGSGATVEGIEPSSWLMGLEFGCVYPYASDTDVGRSVFSNNKVGRCGSSWLNFSYTTKGCHYMTFQDNVFDFSYNDHGADAHNSSPWSSAANLNYCTFDGNTWTLGTANNQPYYMVSGGTTAQGGHDTFVGETWTKPSGTIGSWVDFPFTDSDYTDCVFHLPKAVAFAASATGSGNTFDNGYTGGDGSME